MNHEPPTNTTGEIIGKRISVEHAPNKNNIGISGTIIDETKHLIIIETTRGIKRVPKRGAHFLINNTRIKGDDILEHPVERTKMR
jgi:ribonuclease P protein subunit POP4